MTPVDTAYRTPKAQFPLSHEGALRRRSEVTQVEAWERWVLRRVGVEPVRKRPQPHDVLTRKPLVRSRTDVIRYRMYIHRISVVFVEMLEGDLRERTSIIPSCLLHP